MMKLHMSTVPAVESECACLNCPALFEGWSWTVARPAKLAKQLDNWWAVGPNAHPFFISVDFLSDQIMKSSYQIPYQSLNFLAISLLSDQNINNFLPDSFAVPL